MVELYQFVVAVVVAAAVSGLLAVVAIIGTVVVDAAVVAVVVVVSIDSSSNTHYPHDVTVDNDRYPASLLSESRSLIVNITSRSSGHLDLITAGETKAEGAHG